MQPQCNIAITEEWQTLDEQEVDEPTLRQPFIEAKVVTARQDATHQVKVAMEKQAKEDDEK